MSPPIRLAYSVDADDAFMFHALREGLVEAGGLAFVHERLDTAALNALAARGEADVVAVSAGLYPEIADRYLLLPHGASVGRAYGPVVIAKRAMKVEELPGTRVGIPGLSTTAFLVLRLIEPHVVPVVIPIAPFARIFETLDRGDVDAALLIHEGRLLFAERGYHEVVETGRWWHAHTGLPLPLGVNVIRRGLGPELVARVSDVLRRSIAWALAHKREMVGVLGREDRGDPRLADPALLDRYLGMYANDDTRELPDDARRALTVLYERARAAGLVADVRIEFAP